jgi:hypothetical protein
MPVLGMLGEHPPGGAARRSARQQEVVELVLRGSPHRGRGNRHRHMVPRHCGAGTTPYAVDQQAADQAELIMMRWLPNGSDPAIPP